MHSDICLSHYGKSSSFHHKVPSRPKHNQPVAEWAIKLVLRIAPRIENLESNFALFIYYLDVSTSTRSWTKQEGPTIFWIWISCLLQKAICKNQAAKQTFGPSYFVMALVWMKRPKKCLRKTHFNTKCQAGPSTTSLDFWMNEKEPSSSCQE